MGTLQMHLRTTIWDKPKDSGLNIRRKHIRKNSFSLVVGEVTEFQLREKRLLIEQNGNVTLSISLGER